MVKAAPHGCDPGSATAGKSMRRPPSFGAHEPDRCVLPSDGSGGAAAGAGERASRRWPASAWGERERREGGKGEVVVVQIVGI